MKSPVDNCRLSPEMDSFQLFTQNVFTLWGSFAVQ